MTISSARNSLRLIINTRSRAQCVVKKSKLQFGAIELSPPLRSVRHDPSSSRVERVSCAQNNIKRQCTWMKERERDIGEKFIFLISLHMSQNIAATLFRQFQRCERDTERSSTTFEILFCWTSASFVKIIAEQKKKLNFSSHLHAQNFFFFRVFHVHLLDKMRESRKIFCVSASRPVVLIIMAKKCTILYDFQRITKLKWRLSWNFIQL